ncbi:hypothetical protein QR680_003783 [Steinernema hermaphroditum]|uniref:Uncharacterized protein n=1 Tax=Steinernema hermaphroditum TaxID=289476 RepID=A0AA39HNT6_9BILA|nr:hypothetical protein QR680_003783 [Steinernema hermaphroditum]
METVPIVFVDSVAELLDPKTLENLADSNLNCLWSQIADVHKRERKYYSLELWQTEEDVYCAFNKLLQIRLEYMDIRDLQKIESRFLRLPSINDSSQRAIPEKRKVLKFGRDEFPKFEKLIHRHFPGKVGECYSSNTKYQEFMLRALHGKIYLTFINIANTCPLAEDFVKDQIENSAFLRVVNFIGEWDWGSMLEHVKKFCFRPGRERTVFGDVTLDRDFYQDLRDFWRANDDFAFEIYTALYEEDAVKAIMPRDGESYCLMDESRRTIVHQMKDSLYVHNCPRRPSCEYFDPS